jgi:predicted MFS family arabinose efflux permease
VASSERPHAPPRPRHATRLLFRRPGYAAFFAAATLSRMAEEMFSVAVVLLVLARTGSATLAGGTVAAATLPTILSGPILGTWLDRTHRRRAALAANEAVLAISLIAIAAIAGRAPAWLVPAVAVLAGLTSPMATGGFTSMVAVLVGPDLLFRANALEATSFNSASVAGPAIAGAIAATAGPGWAVAVQVGLSVCALGLIALMPSVSASRGDSTTRGSAALVEGIRHLLRTPALRGVTLATAVGLGAQGLLTVGFPFFALSVGASRNAAGYLWGALAVGSTLGALGVSAARLRIRPELLVFGGLAALGALVLTWPLAHSLPVAVGLVALAGIADGPALTATFEVRQRWSPAELHGRIFTTGASVKIAAFAIGSALAGPAVLSLGVRTTIVIVAVLQFVGVAAGLAAGAVRR